MWTNVRVAFTLVPWRMRPKLILLLLGSIVIAALDTIAVVLMLPVMELASGATISQSRTLSTIAQLIGTEERDRLLLATLGGVLALMVSKSALTLVFRWWSTGMINRAQTDATKELLGLFMTSPYEVHRRRVAGDIITAIQEYTRSAFSGVTLAIIQVIVDAMVVVAILVALLIMSPLATLLAIIFFGGSAFLIQAVLRKRLIALGEIIRVTNITGWRYLSPAIDGFKQARLSEAERVLSDGFIANKRRQNEAMRMAVILGEMPRHLLEILMVIGIGLLGVILLATTGAREAFSILGVFAVASIRMVPSLNRVIATMGGIRNNQKNLSSLAQTVDELRSEPYRDNLDEEPVEFPDADVVISDLTFKFEDAETPLLKNVSTTIKQGSTVALVGSSGAGKTTFVDLLTALYRPTSGSIMVGGRAIHDHPVSWRRHIGVVPQEVFLWAESARRNIAYGVPDEDIDEERVLEAVRMAQLEDVIADLPEGLDTGVGQQGTRFSGGQRQRIGIARALYRRPQLLILDEATSALDNVTEARFTETIEALHGTMTIIIVAHRLSTVRNADEILFFSEGEISGRGTMAELTRSNDEFRELIRLGSLLGSSNPPNVGNTESGPSSG